MRWSPFISTLNVLEIYILCRNTALYTAHSINEVANNNYSYRSFGHLHNYCIKIHIYIIYIYILLDTLVVEMRIGKGVFADTKSVLRNEL